MREKQIMVSQEELEQVVFEETMKQQHMLFDLCLEDYVLLPEIRENKRKKQISMTTCEWESFLARIDMGFGELERARKLITDMLPVYQEYREQYANEHEFDLEHYAQIVTISYSADEFERMRERYENEFYKDIEDESCK